MSVVLVILFMPYPYLHLSPLKTTPPIYPQQIKPLQYHTSKATYIASRFYLGQTFWGGNRGGRAGVKQELCVFNCLIKYFMNLFLTSGRETEPLVGETHPAGLYADKPLASEVSDYNMYIVHLRSQTTTYIQCIIVCQKVLGSNPLNFHDSFNDSVDEVPSVSTPQYACIHRVLLLELLSVSTEINGSSVRVKPTGCLLCHLHQGAEDVGGRIVSEQRLGGRDINQYMYV